MDIIKEYKNFLNEIKSVMLASIDNNSNPLVSYAPFVLDEELNIYICLSDMVKHTSNLRENLKANLMFIEDELKSENIFARKRLSFDVKVDTIDKQTEKFHDIISLYEKRFKASALICKLPDFVMFKFTPIKGKFIKGFGEAYEIYGDGLREFKLKGMGGNK